MTDEPIEPVVYLNRMQYNLMRYIDAGYVFGDSDGCAVLDLPGAPRVKDITDRLTYTRVKQFIVPEGGVYKLNERGEEAFKRAPIPQGDPDTGEAELA